MKTSIKILILIFFVVVAAAGVLIFVKTQLAPPATVEYKEPYSAPLKENVRNVANKAFPQCKDEFTKVYHKVNFMNQEQLLSNEEANKQFVTLDTVYGNRVVRYAYGIFNSSTWPEDKLSLVSNTMSSLRNDRLIGGAKALTSEMEGSFNQIDRILSDYRSALSFSHNTGFSSVADAQSKIRSIESYKNKPYLRNNRSLMAALDAMPAAIANSHYNHVSAQINRLANYRGMSEDAYYDNLVPSVTRVLNEYKATNIYGAHKKSAAPLESHAQSLLDGAGAYFAELY